MEILNDFNTSVEKALTEIDPKWRDYEGLIVCGTHEPKDWFSQIIAIGRTRKAGRPFLGICFGHQLAAVEYARNVLGVENAHSEELVAANDAHKYDLIVYKLPQLKVGIQGHEWYMGQLIGGQTYWNNYEVRGEFETIWKKADNFITCQYHPEYQSSEDKPHPLLVKFLEECKKYAEAN